MDGVENMITDERLIAAMIGLILLDDDRMQIREMKNGHNEILHYTIILNHQVSFNNNACLLTDDCFWITIKGRYLKKFKEVFNDGTSIIDFKRYNDDNTVVYVNNYTDKLAKQLMDLPELLDKCLV